MTDKERQELAIKHADVEWLIDILKRMEKVIDDDPFIGKDSYETLKWLIKQGMKVKREE
jgi:hypothetical protein